MTEPALVLSAVAMGLAILGALVGVSLLVDVALVTSVAAPATPVAPRCDPSRSGTTVAPCCD